MLISRAKSSISGMSCATEALPKPERLTRIHEAVSATMDSILSAVASPQVFADAFGDESRPDSAASVENIRKDFVELARMLSASEVDCWAEKHGLVDRLRIVQSCEEANVDAVGVDGAEPLERTAPVPPSVTVMEMRMKGKQAELEKLRVTVAEKEAAADNLREQIRVQTGVAQELQQKLQSLADSTERALNNMANAVPTN